MTDEFEYRDIEQTATVECASCEEPLPLGTTDIGEVVLCPYCGSRGEVVADPLHLSATAVVAWDTSKETQDHYAADPMREQLRARGVDVDA